MGRVVRYLIRKYCYNRMIDVMNAYFHGYITEVEYREYSFKYHIIMTKWVDGQCHKLCHNCSIKEECWDNAWQLYFNDER